MADLGRGEEEAVGVVAGDGGGWGEDVEGDVLEDEFVDFDAEFGGQVEEIGWFTLVGLEGGWGEGMADWVEEGVESWVATRGGLVW